MIIIDKFYVLIDGKPQSPLRSMRDWDDHFATSEEYAYVMWHRLVEEGKTPVICKKVDGKFVPIQMGRHLMKGVDSDGISLINPKEGTNAR